MRVCVCVRVRVRVCVCVFRQMLASVEHLRYVSSAFWYLKVETIGR